MKLKILLLLILLILFSCVNRHTRSSCATKPKQIFIQYQDNCGNGYYDVEATAVACIPRDWIEKTLNANQILKLTNSLNKEGRCNSKRNQCKHKCQLIKEINELIQPGWKLCWFNSPDEYWNRLAGRAGWLILDE